jgi:hypothetical protein
MKEAGCKSGLFSIQGRKNAISHHKWFDNLKQAVYIGIIREAIAM